MEIDFPRTPRTKPTNERKRNKSETKPTKRRKQNQTKTKKQQKHNQNGQMTDSESYDSSSDESTNFSKMILPEPKKIQQVTKSTLSVDTLVLGKVYKVEEFLLHVSLPGRLVGTIDSFSISLPFTRLLESYATTSKISNDQQEAPDLRNLFAIGQEILCIVLEEASKKNEWKTKLSCKPDLINKGIEFEKLRKNDTLIGAIKSVEDKGYIVSFLGDGYQSNQKFKGFIQKKPLNKKNKKKEKKYKIGQLVECRIKRIKTPTKILIVKPFNSDNKSEKKANQNKKKILKSDSKTLVDFNQLIPGMIVESEVRRIDEEGIVLGFLTLFVGTVNLYNMDFTDKGTNLDLKKRFKIDQKFPAKILLVNPVSKTIILSISDKDLMNSRNKNPTFEKVKIGDIFRECKIIKKTKYGLFVSIDPDSITSINQNNSKKKDSKIKIESKSKPEQEQEQESESDSENELKHGSEEKQEQKKGKKKHRKPNLIGYIKRKDLVDQISDGNPLKSSKFNLDNIKKGRVIGKLIRDEILTLSFKKSILNQRFLNFSDIKTGMMITVTVATLEKYGILVDITKTIRGLIPKLHLSDIILESPELIFKKGNRIKCRVLSMNLDKKYVFLTNKKTLVKSPYPLITDFKTLQTGQVSHGTIININKQKGLVIGFYNGVTGFAKYSELSNFPIKDLNETFYVGQPVKCRVLNFNRSKKKIYLSLKSKINMEDDDDKGANNNAEDNYLSEKAIKYLSEVKLGEVVSGTINTVTGKCVWGSIDKYGTKFSLYINQISDHESNINKIFESLGQGIHLDSLVVLQKDQNKKQLIVSRKPMLIKAMLTEKKLEKENKKKVLIPRSTQDFKVGNFFYGYIKRILPKFALISFLGDFTFLILKSNISDKFLHKIENYLTIGMTIIAKIIEIDEKNRFILSVRPSVCTNAETYSEHIISYFVDEEFIYNIENQIENLKTNDKEIKISKKKSKKKKKQEQKIKWGELQIGKLIQVIVKKIIVHGAIVTIPNFENITGFISKSHLTNEVTKGEKIKVVIMDFDRSKGIIDLTTKKHLIQQAKKNNKKKNKKNAKYDEKKTMKGKIELVKNDYLVVSIKNNSHIFGFVSTREINTIQDQKKPFVEYQIGQELEFQIMNTNKYQNILKLPNRLLLTHKIKKQKQVNKERKKIYPGRITTAKIINKKDKQMNVLIDNLIYGRIHITQVWDEIGKGTPFSKYEINEEIKVKVLGSYDWNFQQIAHNAKKKNKKGNDDDDNEMKTETETEGKKNNNKLIELTIKPSEINNKKSKEEPTNKNLEKSSIKIGDVLVCYINSIRDNYIWVMVTPRVTGKIYNWDLTKDPKVLNNLKFHYKFLQPLKCKVIRFDKYSKIPILSVNSLFEDENSNMNGSQQIEQEDQSQLDNKMTIKNGDIVVGKITQIIPFRGLKINLQNGKKGFVYLVDLYDKPIDFPLSFEKKKDKSNENSKKRKFKIGEFLNFYVINCKNKTIHLSLKHSLLNPDPTLDLNKEEEEEEVDSDDENETKKTKLKLINFDKPNTQLKVDDLVGGYVTHCTENTIFIQLSDKIEGFTFKNLANDGFIPDIRKAFKPGKYVKGRIIEIIKDTDKFKQVKLDLRNSQLEIPLITWDNVKYGMILKGRVKLIKNFGMFITILKSNLEVLVYSDQVKEDGQPKTDLKKKFKIGQKVTLMISKIDQKNKKIRATLRKSKISGKEIDPLQYCSDDEETDDDDIEIEEENESEESDENDESNDDNSDDNEDEKLFGLFDNISEGKKKNKKDDDDDDDEDDESSSDSFESESTISESEDSEMEINLDLKKNTNSFNIPFQWDDFKFKNIKRDMSMDQLDDGIEDESDEELDNLEKKKLEKKLKKHEKKIRKQKVQQEEQHLINKDKIPESIEDFERLILGSPDSSYIWNHYISYFVSLTEIEKAKQIAERALKSINIREENEKMNVWVAYLNLECLYGNNESLMKLFNRAAQYNDQKKLYLKFVEILELNKKFEIAEQIFKRFRKKLSYSLKFWIRQCLFYIRSQENGIEKARAIHQNSLKALSVEKHIRMISKFAQFEFKFGSPERGRTIFEGIIANYPKRVDIWTIYIDMEKKTGKVKLVRKLFKRAITLKVSSKKIKSLFKKFLIFEKEEGDSESVEEVKQLALNYIKSKSEN
ncbi:protein rrp5 [Anaeramoeba flamelloides]|uniref:Protein rrp5 n=1 Tax=Anaeramoeba flamelloides TaxID=1746091 RepID=A0AAV7YTB5_9EUKA|nr:protein rrp5 [Anaeramoeba flamelloides]